MRNVNIVDAKAHLSKLIERAAAGDTVRITRRRSRRSKRRASGSMFQRCAC